MGRSAQPRQLAIQVLQYRQLNHRNLFRHVFAPLPRAVIWLAALLRRWRISVHQRRKLFSPDLSVSLRSIVAAQPIRIYALQSHLWDDMWNCPQSLPPIQNHGRDCNTLFQYNTPDCQHHRPCPDPLPCFDFWPCTGTRQIKMILRPKNRIRHLGLQVLVFRLRNQLIWHNTSWFRDQVCFSLDHYAIRQSRRLHHPVTNILTHIRSLSTSATENSPKGACDGGPQPFVCSDYRGTGLLPT